MGMYADNSATNNEAQGCGIESMLAIPHRKRGTMDVGEIVENATKVIDFQAYTDSRMRIHPFIETPELTFVGDLWGRHLSNIDTSWICGTVI